MSFLAQPERDTRTTKIFEYLTSTEQKIAYFAAQVPYKSSLILPWINTMLDP
ncbi:MAG: hypothetical protein ACLP5H_03120 [Desulfomonilaceae bacterium]